MGVPGPGLHRGFMQLGVSAFTIHTQLIPPLPPTPAPIPGLIEIPGFMQSLVPPYAAKAGTTVFFDGGHGERKSAFRTKLLRLLNRSDSVNVTVIRQDKCPLALLAL